MSMNKNLTAYFTIVLLRSSSVKLTASPEATDLMCGSNEIVMDLLDFI